MGRFIVLVLDSFGVGEMDDVKLTRPEDIGANTYKSVLKDNRSIKIPTLESLGIANSANLEITPIKFSKNANFGTCNLMHFGCDTFYGHQELMGTKPIKPIETPFQKNISFIEKEFKLKGYNVKRFGSPLEILIINDSFAIGDNLEADLGQVYNITGTFEKISYNELLEAGFFLRQLVKVPRVITFGGKNITIENIKNAYQCKENTFAGINAPKSGVYESGYQVKHMGYGIEYTEQLPYIIGKNIPVTLIGKVADIVHNEYGKSICEVDTEKVMLHLIEEISNNKKGFFCANVQETDLAGHEENSKKYAEKLEVVDKFLKKILSILNSEDILIVTADHGNDPNIGHSHHTREKVPILVFKKNIHNVKLNNLTTLADIGQSAADYFGYTLPSNGKSFLVNFL